MKYTEINAELANRLLQNIDSIQSIYTDPTIVRFEFKDRGSLDIELCTNGSLLYLASPKLILNHCDLDSQISILDEDQKQKVTDFIKSMLDA